MDPERWDRLKELFTAVLDLSASERSEYIARETEGDPELRSDLLSLLAHSLETGSFLDQAVLEVIDIEEATPTDLMLVGRSLGQYRILEKIGQGGMGEVFRALDTRLGRQVAIKILPELFTRNPERLARFEREARALATLNHPNIATIHGLEEADGLKFLVLELVDGETLRTRIAAGPLPYEDLLELAAQIAEGLAKAHQAGIVHRDIKPDNLMLTEDGFVKILDFGLAKSTVETGSEGSMLPTEPALHTELGRVMGTSAYMSPEQARGETVDHRGDQFSFGSVLFEMATGKRAFEGETVADTMVAIMRNEPERIDDLHSKVPGALRQTIDRCLAKDPDKRYAATDELAQHLRNLSNRSHAGDTSNSDASRISPRRLQRPQILAAFLLGGALIAAGLLWRQSTGTTNDPLAAGSGITAVEPRESDRQPRSQNHEMSPPSASIAVLPLRNLGPKSEEYFADGMTDALITHLSRIEALKVISRISVMQYRDTQKSMPEIAGELGVETVLVGSILHGGDKVRISTQLIDASTDQNLWAESYERDLTDILALQSEVAQAVAETVEVEIRPEEEARIASSRRLDPAAHDAYLRGLEDLQGRNEGSPRDEELISSLGYFQRAIEIEPYWAEPWARLAQAYHWIASRGRVDVQAEFYPKAKRAALRAIELDESVALGHAALGFVLVNHEWNWVGALKAYQRAIELDPNLTSWYYGTFLRDAGYYEEAVGQFERAFERSPTSALIQNQLGRALVCAGRFAEAEAEAEDLLGKYPRTPWGPLLLSRMYATTGRFNEAAEVLRKVQEVGSSENLFVLRALGYALASAGDLDQARAILHQLEEAGFDWMPGLYVAVGEKEEAVTQFEAAFAARRDALLQVRCSPDWEQLREVPRIREIAQAIGFPAGKI